MLVLLWGLAADRPLAVVYDELRRMNIPTVFVNQHHTLETEMRLEVGADVRGLLRTPKIQVDLAEVTATYIRPFDSTSLPALAGQDATSGAWRYAAALDEALWSWLDITPALVVNRREAMASNGSKPYQLELIRRVGFSVPETLVTTDPNAARAFWERHGKVIYKSISSIRSIVAPLQMDDLARLNDITFCPTQFQQYVAGVDYRVHVVGDEIYACEIVSDASDYRYPGQQDVDVRSRRIPFAVEQRCWRLAVELQLPVAGIDLRCTPDGEWFCFEVNPAPAFTFYQDLADIPIGNAIARLLRRGPEAQIAAPLSTAGWPLPVTAAYGY
jgi:hypothetical protein